VSRRTKKIEIITEIENIFDLNPFFYVKNITCFIEYRLLLWHLKTESCHCQSHTKNYMK